MTSNPGEWYTHEGAGAQLPRADLTREPGASRRGGSGVERGGDACVALAEDTLNKQATGDQKITVQNATDLQHIMYL
jgi:hypothetical protein